MIIVSISSFFWLNSLISAVENGYASNSQLNYINQFGLKTRLDERLKTLSSNDKKWQAIAKVLAKTDGDIAYRLGEYSLDKQQLNKAKLWFSQAIRLQHQESRLVLAKIYREEKELEAAKKLLLPLINQKDALQVLIDIAVTQGDVDFIDKYAVQLVSHQASQMFYQKLLNYQIIGNNMIIESPLCLANIQPLATNLKNLVRLEELISSDILKPLRAYICFSSVKYISKKDLACQHSNSEAIRCDEALRKVQFYSNTKHENTPRFLTILVEKGGANVNSGILYLDSKDTDEVFFHEIAHLLGFIDEYPLSKNHQRCLSAQSEMFAHNIAVLPRLYQGTQQQVRNEILAQLPWRKYIKPSTKIMTKTNNGWLLGTNALNNKNQAVGVYFSETCSEMNFVSVKPLKQRTALRYFEEVFPPLYLELLKDNPDRFLMSDYKYNAGVN